MITLLQFLAFHLCYNFCTSGSVTVNPQAVDHCELRTTLKRLVENCKRKQFKRMILNELNSFSSKKFQGFHWRKKNVKTHLLMLIHIIFFFCAGLYMYFGAAFQLWSGEDDEDACPASNVCLCS